MSSRYYTKRQHKKRPLKGEKAPKKPNAFKSEAKAKAWADENGIKGYRIESIGDGSKFKIRVRV